MVTPLFLASRSPRRAELLRQIGVRFTVADGDTDESAMEQEPLQDYVLRIARDKALAASRQLPDHCTILAADTAGACQGMRLVKPVDEAHAMRMLLHMSGKPHTVSTAICVLSRPDNRILSCVVNTTVQFRIITPDECHAYWLTGEPHDKAGAYAIQGYGGVFVEKLEGSYSGVVGLPLFETAQLLQQCGVTAWQAPC